MANEKAFDAVQTMRDIRDRISREIAGMTFEEEKRWMREQLTRVEKPRVEPIPLSKEPED